MKHLVSTLVLIAAGMAGAQAAPRRDFWATLDRDGPLSAGWIQVLPVLSTACNFRVDASKLNATLIDLSYAPGNTAYTQQLYNVLYRLDRRQAENRFVNFWKSRFQGDQAAACATAERLWGAAGTQFSGILLREASADATATVNGARPNNCQ